MSVLYMSRNSLPDEEYETVSEENEYRASSGEYNDDGYYDEDDRTEYYDHGYGESSDRLYAGADYQDEGDVEDEGDYDQGDAGGAEFQLPSQSRLRDYLDQAKYYEDEDEDAELDYGEGELSALMKSRAEDKDDSSFNDDGIPPSEDENMSSDFVESDVGDYVPPLTRTKHALVFQLEQYQVKDEEDSEMKQQQRDKVLRDFKNFILKKRAAKAYKRYLKVREMDMEDPNQESFLLEKMELVDKKLHRPYYYEEFEPATYKKKLAKRRRAIKRKYELYALDPEYRKELKFKILTNVGKYLGESGAEGEEQFEPMATGSPNRTMDGTFQGSAGNRTFQDSPLNRTMGSPEALNRTMGSPQALNRTMGSPQAANQTFGSPGAANRTFGSPQAANRTFGSPQAANQTFGSPGAANRTFGSPMDRTMNRTMDRTMNRTMDRTVNRTMDRTMGSTRSANRTMDGTFAGGDQGSLNMSVFQNVSELRSSEEECLSASEGSSFYDDVVPQSEMDFFSSAYEEDCDVYYPGAKSRTCERYKRYLAKCRSQFFDTDEMRAQKKIRAAEIEAQFLNYLDKRRALKGLSRMKVVEKLNCKHPVEEAEQHLHMEMVDKKLHKAYYYARDEPDTYKVLLGKRRRAIIRKYERYAQSENYRDQLKTDIYSKVLRIRPSPIFDATDSEYDSESSFNDSEIPSSEEQFMSEGEVVLPRSYEKPITRRRRQLYEELEQYEPDGLNDTDEMIIEKRKRRLELIQRFKDSLAGRRQQRALQRLKEVKEMGITDHYMNATALKEREVVDKKLHRGFYYSPGEPEEFKELLAKRIRAIDRKARKYATDNTFREHVSEKYQSARPQKIEPDIEGDLAWANDTLPRQDKYGEFDQTLGEDYTLPLFDNKVARKRDFAQAGIWPPHRQSAPPVPHAVWPPLGQGANDSFASSYDVMPRQYFKGLLQM